MKLILCLDCHDVYKLDSRAKRSCRCGLTWGYYLPDGLLAEVSDTPETQVLGFANPTLAGAIRSQREHGDRGDGMGREFTAFLMPDDAPNVRKVRVPNLT